MSSLDSLSSDLPVFLSLAMQHLVKHLGAAPEISWTRNSLYTFLYRELSQLGALRTLDAYAIHLPASWGAILKYDGAEPMRAEQFLALFASHLVNSQHPQN
jgi:hypothetical protein